MTLASPRGNFEETATPPESVPGPPLTPEEAAELARYVARLTDAELDLPTGLESAATQVSSESLRSALRHLATQLRGGADLATLLTDERMPLSGGLRSLLRAAGIRGNLPEILLELIAADNWRRDYWRGVRAALAYPLLLLGLALLVADFVSLVVLPQIYANLIALYDDLSIDFKSVDYTMLQTPTTSWVLSAGLLAVALLLMRMFLSSLAWGRLIRGVPLFGPILWWHPSCEWVVQLRLLLQAQVPLPEAMACLPDMLRQVPLQEETVLYADHLRNGGTLADALEAGVDFPPSLIPLIRWGENRGGLIQALTQCESLLKQRLDDRRDLLRGTLPPMIIFLVIGIAFWLIFRIFVAMIPIIDLLGYLS
ncbi:MAG: type II secretion system F family protein [Pirellulaceae bacterium]